MAQVPSEISQQQGTYSVFKSGIVNNSSSTPVPYPDFNEAIYFGGDSRNFKDIIYGSKIRETLNLPIEILTNDSQISRLARRNKKRVTKKIPRPQNAWIIYRRNKQASLEFVGVKSSIASEKIGEMYKNEEKDVLKYFVALSMLASENHFKKYGKEYRYQPKQKQRGSKKSINKQKQKDVKSKENIKNISMIPTPEESPETLPLQAFPLFSITPSSPLSPITPPTPASSIATSQEDFFIDQFISPATSQEDFFVDQFISPVTSQEDLSVEQIMMMYQTCPPLSDINPSHVASEEQPLNGNFSEFLLNAESLMSLPATTTTNIETSTPEFDFCLYPGYQESTMNMEMDLQTPVNNGYFFSSSLYDPEWQITNDTLLFPEQMDHSYGYNTNEQPSL